MTDQDLFTTETESGMMFSFNVARNPEPVR